VAVALAVFGSSGGPAGGTTTGSTVPSYCDAAMPNCSVTGCEAEHSSELTQANALWPSTGTSMDASAAASTAESIVQSQQAAMQGAAGSSSPPVATASHEYSTTYAGAGQIMEATNPLADPSPPVWIVTTQWNPGIESPAMGLHPDPSQSLTTTTTTIIDAISGKPIDQCLNCDVVQSDGSVEAQDGAAS
jgi:hypothetical protein